MTLEGLPDGWVVWNEEPETVVLAYRPDVFDGQEFPAPCLPTIYVSKGQRDRRPGSDRVGSDWWVTLYLEPDVEGPTEQFDDREGALQGTITLAERFVKGEVDIRSLYQVDRPEYLDRLAELTGPD